MHITSGYGDYLVFHQLPDGTTAPPSKKIFDLSYRVLQEYSPLAMIQREDDRWDKRYDLIREKVKKIDPSLRVAFVPRTLLELIFMRKALKEDLKQHRICPLGHGRRRARGEKKVESSSLMDLVKKILFSSFEKQPKCWHRCFVVNPGQENPEIGNMAYLLNKTAVKTLKPTEVGLTLDELSAHTENELAFLRQYHAKGAQVIQGEGPHHFLKVGNDLLVLDDPGNRDLPANNFTTESSYCDSHPMGIRSDADAEIIKNAILVECSETAQDAFLLYRGSQYGNDSLYFTESANPAPISLSYGTGLFAGALYDGGATAFHYMRQKENDAFVIPVPFSQLKQSPFIIRSTNVVEQICGYGEAFHVRTKVGGETDVFIRGIGLEDNNGARDLRRNLKSHLSSEEVQKQFDAHKSKAIFLGSSLYIPRERSIDSSFS